MTVNSIPTKFVYKMDDNIENEQENNDEQLSLDSASLGDNFLSDRSEDEIINIDSEKQISSISDESGNNSSQSQKQTLQDEQSVNSNLESKGDMQLEASDINKNYDLENRTDSEQEEVTEKEPHKFEYVEDPHKKATTYLSKRHIFELFQVSESLFYRFIVIL